MGQPPKNVLIVGGSISGLMHGVVLKSLGQNVRILEARDPEDLKAEAGGLSLGPHGLQLMKKFLPDVHSYAFLNTHTQFLGADGTVLREIPIAFKVETSSWNLIYGQLKEAFLHQPPNHGKGVYETGKRATDIMDASERIVVSYEDVKDGTQRKLEADLVIAADGGRSIVRSKVIPDIYPKYAGYVAWRGCVPEALVPTTMKAIFDGKLLMHLGKNNYILAYLIPALNGEITPGKRLLDWVWYDLCDKNSHEFNEIMTDSSGRRRNVTVPKGYLSKTAWEKRLSSAKPALPDDWFEVVSQAQTPFVTAITSFDGTKASFFNGKLILAGDAFTQFRPHLGLSCDQAALQALQLTKVFSGEITLEQGEKVVLDWSREFSLRSAAMGQFGLTGKYPEGYVPLYVLKEREAKDAGYNTHLQSVD
ncbi:FAD/NAD(P)-binding domain-containing protein [Lojkania enalia]|uniref:FAD/NAD(P)-binding domain-containing protein n=1 Tax=Lojkania enalia TaxID=147567 RepID=A0A9P4KDN7_9PLEO|nr:FAD/NAD(P)-binding domain-containing protein [Didymosphaeria enalia]